MYTPAIANSRIYPYYTSKSTAKASRGTFGVLSALEPLALNGYLGTDWYIHQSIPLEVQQESDGWFVVSDAVFLVYGDGATLATAGMDYMRSLHEFCEMVRESAQRRPEDVAQYQHILAYIRPLPEER